LKKKKPDSVAWDETTENYVSKILPYATSVSGPVIDVPNVNAFKKKGVEKASAVLQAEWNELQEKIKTFATQARHTQQVYNADFKFEPVVGEVYYLYEGKENAFLSLIPPTKWKQTFLGAFRLNSEYRWEMVTPPT